METGREWTLGRVLALVLVSGGLVAAVARCRTASNMLHERTAHVDVELEVDFPVDDACLSRVLQPGADGVTSVRGYGTYAVPTDVRVGTDGGLGGAVRIQVVYADHVWSTIRVVSVVSEMRAEAHPVSSEQWRAAEQNADRAIEKYLSQCVSAKNVVKRSCLRRVGSSSSTDCGTDS